MKLGKRIRVATENIRADIDVDGVVSANVGERNASRVVSSTQRTVVRQAATNRTRKEATNE